MIILTWRGLLHGCPMLMLVLLGSLWTPMPAGYAASGKSTRAAADPPGRSLQSDQARSVTDRGKRPLSEGPDSRLTDKPTKKPSDRSAGPHPRRSKTRTKRLAMVTPKPDLSYYGVVENRRRYKPDRAQRKGGVPNPQTSTILHDHFLELDKNRDGMIDPVERAWRRLDIHRDLSTHQWN